MHVLRVKHTVGILAASAILALAATGVVKAFHARLGNRQSGGQQAASQSAGSKQALTASQRSHTRVIKVCDLPEKEEYSHLQVQFLNEGDGWVSTGRKLWKTTDAAQTWQCIFDAGSGKFRATNVIYDFQFVSADLGWILTFEELRKTTDGGLTWKLLPNPIADGWLRSFKFLKDGKVGRVGGGLYKDLGEDEGRANRFYAHDGTNRGLFAAVFRTEDGGATWRSEPVSRSPGNISGFYFLDRDHGWATGEAGDFYFRDGKWFDSQSGDVDDREDPVVKCEEIAIGAPTYCPIALWFVDTRVGWLSNSNGYIGKSTNGGVTWADIVSLGAEDPNYVLPPAIAQFSFFDASTAWGLDWHGNLRTTFDGGATWTALDLGLDLEHMFFLDAGHGWAVSRDALFRITP